MCQMCRGRIKIEESRMGVSRAGGTLYTGIDPEKLEQDSPN